MASILDVAAHVLRRKGRMTTMKLQKLCYYSQGWSLAWDGEPIFDEQFEAWANGPVAPALFDAHRGMFSIDAADLLAGDPARLTDDQIETIEAVLAAYGELSGRELSDKTHRERPWLEARGELAPGARSRELVSLEVMQDFFGGLDQYNDPRRARDD